MNLDEIERRANAATPGPWRDKHQVCSEVWGQAPDSQTCSMQIARVGHAQFDALNAAFIAAARTDVPALIARVRELEAECERMKTFAAQSFSAIIRQEVEQMREYGLSYEGVRQVLREYDNAELSFGKVMDLIRAAARAMAEDASSVHPSSLTDVVTALEDDLRIERENVAELEERLVLCQRTNDRMREKIGVKPPPWRTKTEGFEDPGEGVVTAGDLIGLRRKK